MIISRLLFSSAKLFAPALITWVLWAYVLTINQAWAASFGSYWTMSIAMVFGSLLAGSTPCSAGVVIYPVTQLAPLDPAPDSRDISAMLQAFGLAAATYTILLKKPALLHGTSYLLFFFCVFGAVGVVIGLIAALARGISNVVFTSTVFGFAIAYSYASELLPQATAAAAMSSSTSSSAAAAKEGEWAAAHSDVVTALLACACGVGGGFLTATIGTGADIALYAFGVFGWNVRHPRLALGGEQLTAAAVVTMAIISNVFSLARALTGGFSRPTLLCWAAMVPVVVVGAPVGSLVLSPAAATWLRRLFYVLAACQFITYVIFAEDLTSTLWKLVLIGLIVESLAILSHYFVYVRGRERGQYISSDAGAELDGSSAKLVDSPKLVHSRGDGGGGCATSLPRRYPVP